ncbi:hypothetical protein DIPPA_00982 [Diplonema papillatum]|nr:hypothetical protein DIPPA_00982 [Diplonema papillatum]|eukprot:gene21507-33093_t
MDKNYSTEYETGEANPEGDLAFAWFGAKDVLQQQSGAGESPTAKQRIEPGKEDKNMRRWEDNLSDFHLQPKTFEQMKARRRAQAKTPLESLTNANFLPTWHKSQASMANAMMSYHGLSRSSRMSSDESFSRHSTSAESTKRRWRDNAASDKPWRQLDDWHKPRDKSASGSAKRYSSSGHGNSSAPVRASQAAPPPAAVLAAAPQSYAQVAAEGITFNRGLSPPRPFNPGAKPVGSGPTYQSLYLEQQQQLHELRQQLEKEGLGIVVQSDAQSMSLQAPPAGQDSRFADRNASSASPASQAMLAVPDSKNAFRLQTTATTTLALSASRGGDSADASLRVATGYVVDPVSRKEEAYRAVDREFSSSPSHDSQGRASHHSYESDPRLADADDDAKSMKSHASNVSKTSSIFSKARWTDASGDERRGSFY